MRAVDEGDVEKAGFLAPVQSGVQTEAWETINGCYSSKWTALMRAVRHGQVEAARSSPSTERG